MSINGGCEIPGRGAVCSNNTPDLGHFEASFIGEESACCQDRKQQIPRAIKPRFGVTIVWILKLHRCEILPYVPATSRYVAIKNVERIRRHIPHVHSCRPCGAGRSARCRRAAPLPAGSNLLKCSTGCGSGSAAGISENPQPNRQDVAMVKNYLTENSRK
jgi:hypothetical protein